MSSIVSGRATEGAGLAGAAGAAAGVPGVPATSPGRAGAARGGTPRTPPVVSASEAELTGALVGLPVGQITGLPGWTPPPSA